MMKASVSAKVWIISMVIAASAFAGETFTALSMLTHDGRRMISRRKGGKTVYELVPTNALPANLPPVREWTIYAVKSAHTDIGLHNSQYIQRHGTVRRIDEARRLIAADPDDSDPGAFRYVAEGAWFWGNYPQDRGEAEARSVATNEIARGRLDVGVTCAGNHTHLYGFEELCRSIYTKRELEDRWGIKTRTMLMTDNPGISWSIVAPYAEAGVEHVLFSPNHWNPHPSTIWKMDVNRPWSRNNPDAGGGGSRIDVRWDSAIPMLFWWKAPQGGARLLVWTCPHYGRGGEPFGIITAWNKMKPMSESEPMMARQLAKMEARYPYDVWLFADYEDDEWPSTRQADLFKKWNAKWKWPQLRTCGRLDEPFDRVKARWGDKIPTLRGEMTSGWLQHAACTPELLARKMAADRALARAETLTAIKSARDKAAYPAEDLRRAWDALIWNDEHSYGVSGYSGRRVFETWMQHRDWIERAEHTASNELASAAAKFVPDVSVVSDVPARACPSGITENRWYRVAVTNGVVYSIYDRELQRELLEGPANEFRYTRDNHKTWMRGDEAARALGAEMVQKVWLSQDEKKIVLESSFSHARDLFNTSRYDRFGYMAFPFAVPQFRFAAQLNGPVIDPIRDQSGLTSDAYTAVRDWCAVENGEFGVALVMADSCLTEFGEIHPDKTCYGGPVKSSGIYPYLFTDWLQMHNPDGDSFNFSFRYAITSYAGTWQSAHIPAFAERALDDLDEKYYGSSMPLSRYDLSVDSPAWNVQLLTLKRAEDGRGLIARFREREGRPCRVTASQHLAEDAEYTLCNVIERDVLKLDGFAFDIAPFGYATIRIDAPSLRFATKSPDDSAYAYTGLITAPRAGHGGKDGQMYVLWGAEMSPDFDHYELWRDGKFLANVTNEAPDGVAYRVARYEDLGLPTHSRHEYRIRKVWKDGRKDPLCEPFYGLTRAHHNGTTLTLGTPFRRSLLPASLSGISWAGGNAYYAVSDDVFTGEVGLYPMTIDLATNGLSVISCSIPSPTNRISFAKAYDLEDVAFDAVNGTVWVADETRGTVKEYRVADGTVVRTLSLPEGLKKTRSNLGIESLTLSPDGKTLWTCTEEALACDGARSSPTNGTTVRLLKYTRPTAKEGFTLAGTYSYTTDVWSQRFDYVGKGRRGVSGLCALPDGSLLVLERELSFGGAHPLKAAATARLSFDVYRVEFPRGSGGLVATNVRKVKLASGGGPVFAFGNYEGICLGPRLPDGKRSVLLISDAGDGVSQPMILPMVLSSAP